MPSPGLGAGMKEEEREICPQLPSSSDLPAMTEASPGAWETVPPSLAQSTRPTSPCLLGGEALSLIQPGGGGSRWVRLRVAGWGGEPGEPQWSPELGSDRRLCTRKSLPVPAIDECPEASPCFFVHYPFLVTVGKDLAAPQRSNRFSLPSPWLLFKSPAPDVFPFEVLIRREKNSYVFEKLSFE